MTAAYPGIGCCCDKTAMNDPAKPGCKAACASNVGCTGGAAAGCRGTPFEQTCTGSSANLPQVQCNAWGAFYISTGGENPDNNWINCFTREPRRQTRIEPCSCKGTDQNSPVCSSDGTTITHMCVCCNDNDCPLAPVR